MQLIILDLDETLIFSSVEKTEEECDFTLLDVYRVKKRPHLDYFLNYVFRHFRVAVWTSASKDYADGVIQNIFDGRIPEFIWYRDKCTMRRDIEINLLYYVKNLKKVQRSFRISLAEIIMVDDNPRFAELNYGNLIKVTPWQGDSSDNELHNLTLFLEKLTVIENVRKIEKRNWRDNILV